jgi:hypothetical protein
MPVKKKVKIKKTKVVEKLETHISYAIFFNRAFCVIAWKNVLERGRSQMTVLTHAHCMLDT